MPAGTRAAAAQRWRRRLGETRADERRFFTRLQAPTPPCSTTPTSTSRVSCHSSRRSGQRDNTLILVLSDNGASQEGGLARLVNAMGPYNCAPEPWSEKAARIEDIGGPKSHSNFPIGWAMASNTPLRRYKQNTHGGGIRDPLVVIWPKGIAARGELRHQFCHASDSMPTLLDFLGIDAARRDPWRPADADGGRELRAESQRPERAAASTPQYFEMFGHRGLWLEGGRPSPSIQLVRPSMATAGNSIDLDKDFAEVHDLAGAQPERLQAMIARWWARRSDAQVLPLDDRLSPRFAESAARVQGQRRTFVFHAGMGHLPTDVAPDLRSRSYLIEADCEATGDGVLIAHGDMTSGYSLFIENGHLVHDLNIGGSHQIVRSTRPVPPGPCRLGFRMRRSSSPSTGPQGTGPRTASQGTGTLLIDSVPAGEMTTNDIFRLLISWSGLDIGRDRGSPVSHYVAPFAFAGKLNRVTVSVGDDQAVDHDGVGRAEMARQ